ncbi:hypothetical protein LMH73_011660 [Vibrio splendidus]|nr:hypothetical protein [Vibrio splendidus]MCC4883048.1 hypothetical protein [Vibrio splendidus]
MFVKILSLCMSTSDKRVRIPTSLVSEMLEFSGATTVANALPVIEQVIGIEEYINTKLEDGFVFIETDANKQSFAVKWVYEDAAVKADGAESRIRMTNELHDKIIQRSGKETFSEALPYLQSAFNMAKLIRGEINKGSSYALASQSGEKEAVEIC